VPLAAAAVLVVFGGVGVDDGSVTFTNPAPVAATLQQVASGSVPDGRVWVTVTGVLQPNVHEVHSNNTTDYIYVMTDVNDSVSILVRSSDKPLEASAAPVTLSGLIEGSSLTSFVSDWDTLNPWSRWAKSTYPSLKVASSLFLDANRTPSSSLYLVLGIGLWLVALWLVIGCLIGFIVFIKADRRYRPTAATYPNQTTWVRISGRAFDQMGNLTRWRETVAVIEPPNSDTGDELVRIESDALLTMQIDPKAIREARPGSVFPWSGEKAAIRLRTRDSQPLVISFNDVATRDGWLLLLGHSVVTPNVIRTS
jgi:hypothetical protein